MQLLTELNITILPLLCELEDIVRDRFVCISHRLHRWQRNQPIHWQRNSGRRLQAGFSPDLDQVGEYYECRNESGKRKTTLLRHLEHSFEAFAAGAQFSPCSPPHVPP